VAERKKRVPIDRELAARVLYLADRTCCVCRQQGKQVQIHHIDDNPSNNKETNLAALCFDCHHLTQIRGGFGRHLDPDQVTLYRDSWLLTVKRQRGDANQRADEASTTDTQLELATSIAEIYKDNGEYVSLAMHYDAIGNVPLRDKYIERVLEDETDDLTVLFLRGSLQGRPDLIPDEVGERILVQQEDVEDWSQRARTLRELGRWQESARDYCRSILRSLETGNTFSAAYYMKELCCEEIHQELFIIAFAEATELWWKVRALDELGDREGLAQLLLNNETEIRNGGDVSMIAMLEEAHGNERGYIDARKRLAESEVSLDGGAIGYIGDRPDDEVHE